MKKPNFPIGTLAYYGPDKVRTTKIVAGVLYTEHARPIIRRYVAPDCLQSETIHKQVAEFFADHGVKTVLNPAGNIGCPHEQGKDYTGEDCPFFPYRSEAQR